MTRTNDAPIIESIMHSGKIFIAGAGRTGYIMRCFAMRLIHLGFCAYVIGDTEMIAAKAGSAADWKRIRRNKNGACVYGKSQTAGDENGCVYLQQGIPLWPEAKFSCVIRAQSKFQDGRISVQPMGDLLNSDFCCSPTAPLPWSWPGG